MHFARSIFMYVFTLYRWIKRNHDFVEMLCLWLAQLSRRQVFELSEAAKSIKAEADRNLFFIASPQHDCVEKMSCNKCYDC
mmetsp:Transcript_5545/g.10557  ORF Transcript_5545/g.10557 Transcript_5545/m.10557 type:complete len:81 (-) Transcript_5545:855-1097(-)